MQIMDKILIITHRHDAHARAVYTALRKKGAFPILWFPEEFLLNQKASQMLTSRGEHFIMIDNGSMINRKNTVFQG